MMGVALDDQKGVVREALSLLKGAITRKHLTKVSKLPRNGKSPVTVSSEAEEMQVYDKIKHIDFLLGQYSGPSGPIHQPSRASLRYTPTVIDRSSNLRLVDNEPYVNPFTGLMVYPESADTPGPSNATRYRPSPTIVGDNDKLDRQFDTDVDHATRLYAVPPASSMDPTALWPPVAQFLDPTSGPKHIPYQENKSKSYAFIPENESATSRTGNFQNVLDDFEKYFDEQVQFSHYMPSSDSSKFVLSLDNSTTLAETETETETTVITSNTDTVQYADSDAAGISRDVRHSQLGIEWLEQIEADKKLAAQLQEEENLVLEHEKLDLQLAQRLAEDTPQHIVDQNQEESALTMAQLQALQDEWNQEWEESVRQQQILSQRVAEQEQQKEEAMMYKEMRRLQETFQAEENQQIEADRKLALMLSEGSGTVSPVPLMFPSPTRPTPDHVQPYHPPPASSPLRRKPVPARIWSTRDGITNSNSDSEQAERAHDNWRSLWEAEIEKNAQAARAAQQQILDLTAQAQRDQEYALELQHQQQREEEVRQQEAKRQREAEEAARRARLVDCMVCGDSADRDMVYRFPCSHIYCQDCLRQSIQDAVKSKKVFKCCKNTADPDVVSQFLPSTLMNQYRDQTLELTTKNPVYCSNRGCSSFIPPSSIKAGTATCPKCRVTTCANCRSASHTGIICREDKDGQAVLKLGNTNKWKICPHCKNMVERSAGCLHMVCRCGHDFCYNCGKASTQCKGNCKR